MDRGQQRSSPFPVSTSIIYHDKLPSHENRYIRYRGHLRRRLLVNDRKEKFKSGRLVYNIFLMLIRTLVSPSTSSILRHLSNIKTINPQESTLLFALSSNAPDIEAIVTHLRQTARHSIGCLSASWPGKYAYDTVCSIAYMSAKDCVLFRSEIPGRPPIQVGRWHTARHKNIPPTHLPDFSQKASSWAAFEGSGEAADLPEPLRGRRCNYSFG